jgi:hypothetical protein
MGHSLIITPIEIEELTLGAARRAGRFPAQIEHACGFHIGGLISHEFFRPYALTLDFSWMRFLLERKG